MARGEQYVDGTLAPPPDVSEAHRRSAPAPGESLGPIEEELLRLVASAYSNQDIARQLGLTAADQASIKAPAMRKAGIKTRLDAIAYARERGWT